MSTIGLRIQQARRRRGLSLRGLAEGGVGVSATTLSKYERGESTPDSGTLIRISKVLGYGIDFFLRPVRVGEIQPAYRKGDALSKKEERQVVEEVRDWLERYLEAERVRGDADPFAKPPGVPYSVGSFDDVEEAALKLRASWEIGLDPIEDLTGHLEDHGVRVGRVAAPVDFDACAFWADADGAAGPVPVVATNRDRPGDRQRYNLAHELGHLVLDVQEDSAVGFTEEKACHRFAGAFLAPRPTLTADLGEHRKRLSPRELYILKQKYGLSMNAILYRAHDLGVIPESEKRRLFDAFDAAGWRTDEPGDPVEVEEPTRFRLLVLQALSEGLIGRRRAEELYTEGPLATPREEEVLGTLAFA